MVLTLDSQSQQVKGDNSPSDSVAVTSGVPQGSYLGPILFAIYLEDLLRLLSGVECSAYADDLKIYKPMCCDEDSRALQVALDVIREWSNANGMNLNLSK